jgi:hypothetical protein
MQEKTRSKAQRTVSSYPVLIQYKNICKPEEPNSSFFICKSKNVRIFAAADKAEEMGLDNVKIEFRLPKAHIATLHSWFSFMDYEQEIPIKILVEKWLGSIDIDILLDPTINRPYYEVWGWKDGIVVLKKGSIKIPDDNDKYVYAILTPRYDISITVYSDDIATVVVYDRRPPLPQEDLLLEAIRQKLSLQ